MTKKHSELIIYSDGGSRGNPGPAAVGVVLFDTSHKVVSEISRTIGEATNNVAEYMGVIYGLMEAVYLGASTVTIKVDSQLIARQLKGE
ncbi:MAG TPA: ribonuclease HI family protein, partial [Candidatus Omnitrophota bacterium]|nr:ribonuclease HI family protein [Candidatus Omnitrophota bacterium]